MGCIWSNEGSRERCKECGTKAVNNLVIENQICEICVGKIQSTFFVFPSGSASHSFSVPPRSDPTKAVALFGEYRCSCGHRWNSRLSWANSYQICKRCRRRVLPRNQRELRPSDITKDKTNLAEHEKELCQKCQELGHYCGKSGNNRKRY